MPLDYLQRLQVIVSQLVLLLWITISQSLQWSPQPLAWNHTDAHGPCQCPSVSQRLFQGFTWTYTEGEVYNDIVTGEMRWKVALQVRPIPLWLTPRSIGTEGRSARHDRERHGRIVTVPIIHRDAVLVVARDDEVSAASVVEVLTHGAVAEGGLAARVLVRVRVAVVLAVVVAD